MGNALGMNTNGVNRNGINREAINRDAMSRNAYRLLGYVVWRGGKWYVQRYYLSKLPPPRKIALVGAGGVAATGTTVVLARRAVRARRVRSEPYA
ncbi:MAG: hypothetical protein FWD42_06070 [Solirubrobacterales bacterium]|nr:hypothetical protein [Solirubrobacterales bacterium]